MNKNLVLLIFTISLVHYSVVAKTKDEWKSKTIYQIITDRFARTNGDDSGCDNLK